MRQSDFRHPIRSLLAATALTATALLTTGCGAMGGPAVGGGQRAFPPAGGGGGPGLTPPPLETPASFGTGTATSGNSGLPALPVEPAFAGGSGPANTTLAGVDSSSTGQAGPVPAAPVSPAAPATPGQRSAFEAQVDAAMLVLLNRERQAVGAQPVKLDGRLHNAAWSHAYDMFRRGFIDHQNPEGQWAHDRAARAGFPMGGSITNVNENVADIFPRNNPQELAAKAMDMYRQSDGHWKNLLDSKWNVVGLATVYRPDQSTKDSYGIPRTPNAQVFGRL